MGAESVQGEGPQRRPCWGPECEDGREPGVHRSGAARAQDLRRPAAVWGGWIKVCGQGPRQFTVLSLSLQSAG